MSTTSENPPGVDTPGATTKKDQEKPWSYRPGKNDAEVRTFLQQLMDQYKSPQAVMAHCVKLAMAKGVDINDDIKAEAKAAIEQVAALHKIIAKKNEEIAALQANNQQPATNNYSEKAEAFIQKMIDKKKTNRHNAIEACILWTKENKLFL